MRIYEATEVTDLLAALFASHQGSRLVRVHLADERALEALHDALQNGAREKAEKKLKSEPAVTFAWWQVGGTWPLDARGWCVLLSALQVSAQRGPGEVPSEPVEETPTTAPENDPPLPDPS